VASAADAAIQLKSGEKFGLLLPGFSAKNSSVHRHGFLTEAVAIAKYLASKSKALAPPAALELKIDALIDSSDRQIFAEINSFLETKKVSKTLEAALRHLNGFSGRNSVSLLPTTALTLADVLIYGAVFAVSETPLLKQLGALSGWFATVSQDKFVKRGLSTAGVSKPSDLEPSPVVDDLDGYETDNEMPELVWPRGFAAPAGSDNLPDLVYPDGYDPTGYDSGLETDEDMPSLAWPLGFRQGQGSRRPADVAWNPPVPKGHTSFSWRKPGQGSC